jgi:glycosyltransferase involved in cell wall biosynthesis
MANGKKTVLVVGPLLPTGGVTRYVRQLLGRTSDSFQYRVFDTARAEKKTAPRNGGYGIILSEGWGHALRGLLVTLSHMAGFPAHLRKSRPHLVHICGVNLWGFWENAYYMCVCRAMGVSVTVHYLDSLDLNWERCGWTERMVVRQVFRLPAGVAVLSQRARQTLLEISPAAYSVVVPSSVDPAAYALSSSRPLGSGDAVRVLFVGGVGPYRKGLHELLGAAEMLWSTGTPVLFVITGPVAEEAAKQAGEWMGENVRFTGIIPEDEMIALYHSVDILALPSYDEGS